MNRKFNRTAYIWDINLPDNNDFRSVSGIFVCCSPCFTLMADTCLLTLFSLIMTNNQMSECFTGSLDVMTVALQSSCSTLNREVFRLQ